MTTLKSLTDALRTSWRADTAYDTNDWSEQNTPRGQCVVSSLIVQDHFGGDLIRYEINEGDLHETHYANFIDGTVIDTTAAQYQQPVAMRRKDKPYDGFASLRDKLLADESTHQRYELLRERVRNLLS